LGLAQNHLSYKELLVPDCVCVQIPVFSIGNFFEFMNPEQCTGIVLFRLLNNAFITAAAHAESAAG
jgi:hypothetical protein